MFTLDEIKEIRRIYQFDENGEIILNKLQNGHNELKAKEPTELTENEKNKIRSALYLFNKVKTRNNTAYTSIMGEYSDEEFLKIVQEGFQEDLTKKNEYKSYTMGKSAFAEGKDLIWKEVTFGNKQAIEYMEYVAEEIGKKINYSLDLDPNHVGVKSISWHLEDKARNEFIESLNPNNSEYTQNEEKVILSPEKAAHRRAFVEKAIQYYNMMEKDEWYNERIEKEEDNMKKIANIVNGNGRVKKIKDYQGLFRILKAAKNLNIKGEKDYLEEILSLKEVNDAIVEFKKSEFAQKMKEEAIKNENEGKINRFGLLMGHEESIGEKENRSAQICIRENPNAVSEAKKELNEKRSIKFDKTTDGIRLSNLYSLILRTQGKMPVRNQNLDEIELNTENNSIER